MSKSVEGRGITLKDLIYVFISVPVSLAIWLVGRSFAQFSNSNGKVFVKYRIFEEVVAVSE